MNLNYYNDSRVGVSLKNKSNALLSYNYKSTRCIITFPYIHREYDEHYIVRGEIIEFETKSDMIIEYLSCDIKLNSEEDLNVFKYTLNNLY